jgi:hypothetical protein
MFGGYLPVETHNRKFFFKTLRQLGAQREEVAKTKINLKKGIDRYLKKSEIRGQVRLQSILAPFIREEKKKCVELLDILEIMIRKKSY